MIGTKISNILSSFLFGSHEIILTNYVFARYKLSNNYELKMEVLMMKHEIQICCSKCRRRLFDYSSNTLSISIKCNRCGRVIEFKNCTEKYFRDRSVQGQMYV